jgi:sugar lactone lactonase YvrE
MRWLTIGFSLAAGKSQRNSERCAGLACSAALFCAAWLAASPAAAQWTIATAAGTGRSENNGDAGAALEKNINQPFGVEIGPDNALYITEVGNHRIWRLNRAANKLSVVAGNGTKGYSGGDGRPTAAAMNEPYEIRFDADGNLYVVEMQNHIVRRVDVKTNRIITLAGDGEAGFAGDGGPAPKARFKQPHSIALSADARSDRGLLYIADIGNHRIRSVDLATGNVETIAGTGEAKLPVDGEAARDKPVAGPRALFVTGDTLWVALREGHSVWQIDLPSGTWKHVAGTGKQGFSGDGGPAASATFNGPKGIAVDADGNAFVVDTENQAIRRIDARTKIITTIAGGGPRARGFAGDGGDAGKAKLDRPHGICVDAAGVVYIGDTNNHRVRAVQPHKD